MCKQTLPHASGCHGSHSQRSLQPCSSAHCENRDMCSTQDSGLTVYCWPLHLRNSRHVGRSERGYRDSGSVCDRRVEAKSAMRDHRVAVRHTSLRAFAPMMFHPASPSGREGGCPISKPVERPCKWSASSPHDTVTDDGEEVALLFPHVIDDFDQAARQRHAGHLLASPPLHGVNVRKGPGRRAACVAARTRAQRSKRLPSLLMCPLRMRSALARIRGVRPT